MLFYRALEVFADRIFLCWINFLIHKEGVGKITGPAPESLEDFRLYKAKTANTAHAESYVRASEIVMVIGYVPLILFPFVVTLPSIIISSVFSLDQEMRSSITSFSMPVLFFIFMTATMWCLGAALGSSQAKRKKKQALKLGEDFDYKPTWFRLPRDISPIISILLILPFVL